MSLARHARASMASHVSARIVPAVLAAFAITCSPGHALRAATAPDDVLNMSTDLVARGIAAQNLTPNQPTLDAGPLLLAAVEYAKAHDVPKITAAPGAYYFLSLQHPDRHVNLYRPRNLTIDFNGADLYLTHRQKMGINLMEAQNTTLQNFSIDWTVPPFTQVKVTAVDPSARLVTFIVEQGYASPSIFNVRENIYALEEPVHVFAFRDGEPVRGLSRMTAARPIAGGSATLADTGMPWESIEALKRIRVGDVLVFTARGAGEPVAAEQSDGVTLRNIRVHSSGINGVRISDSSRTLVERVYVMPRPGTDRLVSSNADGIALHNVGPDSIVRFCRSIRTLDDGVSVNSLLYGTVHQVLGPRTLMVRRQYARIFRNGTAVTFQDRRDGRPIASAVIVSQDPAFHLYPPGGQLVTVHVDRDLPEMPPGAAFYATAATERGKGMLVERNTVQDQVFARGISLWGLVDARVQGNHLLGTHMSAIFGIHRLFVEDWMSPPLDGMVIANNAIERPVTNLGGDPIEKLGAIEVLAQQSDFQQMTRSPHTNVAITGNVIIDAARSAIRLDNTEGGSVLGNTIVSHSRDPHLDGYWADLNQTYQAEKLQSIVTRASNAPQVAGNAVGAAVLGLRVTDGAFRRLVAYAPGQVVLLHALAREGQAAPTVTLRDAGDATHAMASTWRDARTLQVVLPAAAALGGASVSIDAPGAMRMATLFIDTADLEPVPTGSDEDRNGLPDWWQREQGLAVPSVQVTDAASGDPDGDGWANAQELWAGTAARCATTVVPGTAAWSAPTAGGSLSVTLQACDPDATWVASSDASWLLVSPSRGTGGGHVTLSAMPGASAGAPVEAAVLDGTTIAVTQSTPGGLRTANVTIASGLPDVLHRRFLAEGATSSFFDTRIALLNTGRFDTTATVSFLRAGAPPLPVAVSVPAGRRVTVLPKTIAGLDSAEFSIAVAAPEALVVDRTMTWDTARYGSHAETAVVSPAAVWYLAEGATHSGFALFYLLQNPNDTQTTVRVRYLRATGTPLEKTYELPANSRTNIWVNVEDFPGLGQALASAEFSAVVESLDSTPIIVERAMYRSNQGRLFNAGHESKAVSEPSTKWFMAEGRTGPFFDEFVLIANPTDMAADVRVTYLLDTGVTFTRTFVATAFARSSIWVDHEQFPGVAGEPLADVAHSTSVESLNGVPLVVERAMWWPGDGTTWHEAHNSSGAVETGTRWAMAEGEVGGPMNAQTYVLIANTSDVGGRARVTVVLEDGRTLSAFYTLLPHSRTNAAIGPDFGTEVQGQRFGVIVESLGQADGDLAPQIVVERAMYSDANGVPLAAGSNALATRLR